MPQYPFNDQAPFRADNRAWQMVQHPVAQIPVMIVAAAGILAVTIFAPGLYSPVFLRVALVFKLSGQSIEILDACLKAGYAVLLYAAFVRLYEGRWPLELSLRNALRDFLAGNGIALVLMTGVLAVLWIAGMLKVLGSGTRSSISFALVAAILGGVVEEIVTRGLVFRYLERFVGSLFALTLSALLFGLLHYSNPNSGLWPSLAISIEAGFLLGAVYIFSGRLWLPIGLHFGWNLAQGGLFGLPVSGLAMDGALRLSLNGPDWMTGGAFGIEASVLTVVAGFLLSLWILVRAKDKLVSPVWNAPNF